MREIELTNSDEVAVIDDADYQAVSAFDWRIMNTPTGHVYVVSKINGVVTLLHRYLMEPRHKQVVIHLNGDGLDNQRSNLFCGSMAHSKAISAALKNRTGFRGVKLNSEHRSFEATCAVDGRSVHIGYYPTAKEAHEAYRAKMREVYGDLLNSARWMGEKAETNA